MQTYDKKSIQQAVALKYSKKRAKSAPEVVAKGSGKTAEEIISIAKLHEIMLHKDETLLEALATLDIGQEIPENLYLIIAELISFSYLLQGKFPEKWNNVHEHIDFDA